MIHTPNIREVLLVSLLIGLAAAEQNHKTWMDYGGGLDSSHYVALTHVNLTLGDKLGQKIREYVFPVPRPVRFARWLRGRLTPHEYPSQVIQNRYTIRSAGSWLEDNGLKVIDILHTRKYPGLPLIGPWAVIYIAQKQVQA